jgi:predicted transcriptional regulator
MPTVVGNQEGSFMAKDASAPLTAAQMEVMDLVWERGEATVGALWRELSARRPIARNTVQTTIVRLEQRGWLTHRDDGGGVFVYTPARRRGAAVKGMVRRLVDTAFEGSVSGLVMALLENHSLTPDEATRLRSLIDRAEADGSQPREDASS